jgi:alpha-amylase/alpha-mannosidase (GH57 family)
MYTMKKKISIAFLWHMHQPLYKDLVTGRYHLPWVRLHATHSYLDMASMMYRFPGVRTTFNFTPSLLWQLMDISENESIDDTFLNISKKDASYLSEKDKFFLLKNFFTCSLKRAILPVERYKELFSKRGKDIGKEALFGKIKLFSESDFRDLQVLFNLAWCGFTLKEKDSIVKELFQKGSGYTEEEKLALLKRQKEVVSLIIPTYKKLQDEGRIEISTSPFYHPILPLLCHDKSGQGLAFCEDARNQVKRAISFYEEVFDRKPAGMWPSEGAVSQETVTILADEGIKWAATDEAILLDSVKDKNVPREELIHKIFTVGAYEKEISMVFRNTDISNSISFNYSNMPAKEAAVDLFSNKIHAKKAAKSDEGGHITAIILDGENPWQHYPKGGEDFLSKVFELLSSG